MTVVSTIVGGPAETAGSAELAAAPTSAKGGSTRCRSDRRRRFHEPDRSARRVRLTPAERGHVGVPIFGIDDRIRVELLSTLPKLLVDLFLRRLFAEDRRLSYARLHVPDDFIRAIGDVIRNPNRLIDDDELLLIVTLRESWLNDTHGEDHRHGQALEHVHCFPLLTPEVATEGGILSIAELAACRP